MIVVFNFIAGALSLLGTFYRHSVIAAVLFLVVVQAAVLFWRRTQPIAVLLVVIVTMIVAFAIAPDREPSSPALAFAVYAVSVYGPGRARLVVVGAAIVMVVVAGGGGCTTPGPGATCRGAWLWNVCGAEGVRGAMGVA